MCTLLSIHVGIMFSNVAIVSACLKVLHTLQISHNKLSSVESVSHLAECESISVLDLSHNKLEDPAIIDVLAKMPQLVSTCGQRYANHHLAFESKHFLHCF